MSLSLAGMNVTDFGGIFHDDVKPGHPFADYDHRSFRPAGWVEGMTRTQSLKALGNAVVPQQAIAAVNVLARLSEDRP